VGASRLWWKRFVDVFYLPRASVLNMEEQKCEKDFEHISSDGNITSILVLGKFYTECSRFGMALSLKIWDWRFAHHYEPSWPAVMPFVHAQAAQC